MWLSPLCPHLLGSPAGQDAQSVGTDPPPALAALGQGRQVPSLFSGCIPPAMGKAAEREWWEE